jgi:hypothetical protein
MVPWKMCEACREKDRATRKNRTVRNAHAPAEPQSPVTCAPAGSTLVHPVEMSSDTFHDLEATSAPSTVLPLSASTVQSDIDKAQRISRPPSTPALNNDQPSIPSVGDGSPSLMFDELMLPELPDTVSVSGYNFPFRRIALIHLLKTDINAAPHASTSIETFTSVFQANVQQAPTQPKAIRFAKSSSMSSSPVSKGPVESIAATPVHVPPHSGLTSHSPVSGTPSDVDSRQTSDANLNGKRKPRKKRSLNKVDNKVGTIVDLTSVTDLSPLSQENSQMPTTVSPQSIEIIPTQYLRHDTQASTTSTSFTFSQYSAPPYTPSFAPPLPYYVPPPYNPYGSQQLHYPYPPAYPYGRSPYYAQQYPPPLPPYTSGSYRVPPYPYHYPYTHAPYSNPLGSTTPSYTPVSYPQLQWSTNMTPQAPPPECTVESNSSVSAVSTKLDEQIQKRKRDDGDGKPDQLQGSTARNPASEMEIVEISVSPLLEQPNNAIQLAKDLELPASKKQTVSNLSQLQTRADSCA